MASPAPTTDAPPLPRLETLQAEYADLQRQLDHVNEQARAHSHDRKRYHQAIGKVGELETERSRVGLLIAEEQARLTDAARAKVGAKLEALLKRCDSRAFEARMDKHAARLVELHRTAQEVIAAIDADIADATDAAHEARAIVSSLPMVPSEYAWAMRPGVGLEAQEALAAPSPYSLAGALTYHLPAYLALALGVVLGRQRLQCPPPTTKTGLPTNPGEWLRRTDDPSFPVRLLAGPDAAHVGVARRALDGTISAEARAKNEERMEQQLRDTLEDKPTSGRPDSRSPRLCVPRREPRA